MMDDPPRGEILAYDHLLDALKDDPSFRQFGPTFSAIQVKLRALDLSVEAEVDRVNEQLNGRFKNPFTAPVGCDKLNIFLEHIRMLATTHGSDLLIVSIPGEYQIKGLRDSGDTDNGGLCDRAYQHQIACLSLVPNLIKHYSGTNSALYLDGSHFNRQGNTLAAHWIYEWIREQQE